MLVYLGQQNLTQMHKIRTMKRSIIQLPKHYRHVHEIQGLSSILGFQSKVLPGPLTDLNAWVGFCTSSPQ